MADNNFEQDVKEFYFKQMCKLRVFNSQPTLIKDAVNFLSVSNKYGKIYLVAENEIKQIDVSVIEKATSQPDVNLNSVVTNYECNRLQIGRKITHISLSCDDLTLVVIYKENDALWAGCVDVRYFENQSQNQTFFAKGELAKGKDLDLREFEWHPEDPELALSCLSDGQVSMVKINGQSVGVVISLVKGIPGYSVDWSVRGKNFVVAQDDGRLMLYDRKMELKKEVACPNSFDGTKHRAVKVKWVATHNFAAVFSNAEDEEPPKFVCIVTQKDGPTNYLNMEDIYYGFNEERSLCYYIQTLREWNMIVTMASNAFESVVVAKTNTQWVRWALDDSSRAEMPVSAKNEDTFPCGISISLNSTLSIVEGEMKLPPAPIFMTVSTDGVLCSFQMVNKFKDTNHNIILQPSKLTMDNIKQPILEETPRIANQPTAAAPSLPKPFSGSFNAASSAKEPALSQVKGSLGDASQTSSAAPSFGNATLPSFPFGSGTPTLPQPSASNTSQGLPQPFGIKPNIAASVKDDARFIPPNTTAAAASNKLIFATQPIASSLGSSLPSKADAPQVMPAPSARSETIQVSKMPQTAATALFAPATAASSKLTTGAFNFGPPAPVPQASIPKVASAPSFDTQKQATSAPNIVKPSFDFNAKAGVQPQTAQKPAQPVITGRIPPESRLLQTQGFNQPKPAEKPVQQSLPRTTVAQQQGISKQQQQQQQQQQDKSLVLSEMPQEAKEAKEIHDMARKLENALDKCIADEISTFDGELRTFKSHMNELRNIDERIGMAEEMKIARENCQSASKKINNFLECHSEHEKEAIQLKSQMLTAFDQLEEAKMQESKIYDKKYAALLKARSLDPVTARQRKEIRSQLNYITALISDVNDSLDIAWDQAQSNGKFRGKNLKSNNLHNVYVAVESIDKIIDNLTNQLDAVTLNAQNKQVLSSSLASRSSFTRPQESSREENAKQKTTTSPSSNVRYGTPISPVKQSQLRAFLSKRTETPVRRSSKDSFTPIKPKAASTPAFSSTFKKPFDISPLTAKLETVKEAAPRQTALKSVQQQSAREMKPPQQPFGNLNVSPFTKSVLPTKEKVGIAPVQFNTERDEKINNAPPSVALSVSSKPKEKLTSASFARSSIADEKPKTASSGFSASAFSNTAFRAPISTSVPNQPASTSTSAFATGNSSFSSFAAVTREKPSTTLVPKPAPAPLIGIAPMSSGLSAPATISAPFTNVVVAGQSRPTSTGQFGTASTSDGLFGTKTSSAPSTFGGLLGTSSSSAPSTSVAGQSRPTSTGLFGTASTSDGLFGTKTNSASSTFGGLLGTPTSYDKSTSVAIQSKPAAAGLFGTASTSSGLFGVSTSSAPSTTMASQSTPAAAGLFGTASTSGGLFGASTISATSTTAAGTCSTSVGLFGVPKSSVPSTTVAGQSKPTSSGLLGTASSSGGLFGAASTSSSLFGAASTSSGLFGAATSSVPSTTVASQPKPGTAGLFGTASTSGGLFGATTGSVLSTTVASQPKPGTAGLFGAASTTGGLFAAATSTVQSTTVASQPKPGTAGLFGTASTSGGLFAAATSTVPSTTVASQPKPGTAGLFGTASTSGGLFGATTGSVLSTTVASQPKPGTAGLFGAASTTGGLFAAATSTVQSTTVASQPKPGTAGLFGTASTSGGLFAAATSTVPSTTVANQPKPGTAGLFGTASTSGGLFGATTGSVPSTTVASQPKPGTAGLFGTASTSGGLFGATTSSVPSTTVASQPKPGTAGLFGAASTTGGLFAAATSTVPSTTVANQPKPGTAGLFGTASTSGGLFGATTGSVPSTTVASQPKPATAGLFGAASTSSGLFGAASTSSGLFSGAASTSVSSGLFGSQSQTASAAASTQSGLFGSKPSEIQPQNGGLFGSKPSSSVLFGGQSTAATSSAFQSTPDKPAFGQSSSTLGSQQQSSSGMGFGGFGLGGKPTNDPNKNPFGSIPSTSTASSGSSGFFGSSSGENPFGAKTSAATTGGGTFSKGFGSGFSSAGTTAGFGSTTTGTSAFGEAATFGTAPAFGSNPSFGGTPAFGSNPSFGGAPTFGSPQSSGSVFGASSSGQGTFGPAASSPSFGSLGGQTAPTFGSLSPPSTGAVFGGTNQSSQGFASMAQQNSSFKPSSQASSFTSWR